jgi:uncharacterized protein
MSQTKARAEIRATQEAQAAISKLIAEQGPIMFHTSGGRAGGRTFPICLLARELRLGARDHLLGLVDGVAIYEMEDRDGITRCTETNYVLDLVEGPTIGFSITPAPGKRFRLRAVNPEAACERDC